MSDPALAPPCQTAGRRWRAGASPPHALWAHALDRATQYCWRFCYNVGMYLRTIQRRNKNGSLVRYVQLAHNVRDPESGQPMAHVIHSFGREDRLDRAALERLARSILRYLGQDATD